MPTVDFSLSLEELEGEDWGAPDENDTTMVQEIYALRKKPLARLTDGEVHLAVSQRLGASYILDVALQRLGDDPLLDAYYYPGDLLSALIRADESVWNERPDLRIRLVELYEYAMAQPLDLNYAFRESLGLPDGEQPPN